MKKYFFVPFLLLFVSCSVDDSTSSENGRVDDLTNGKWLVSDFEGEENKFRRGIVFSKDRQFFHLDSQGRMIPRHRKIIFELKKDTLKIVDFNFEEKYIKQRGTQIFIVEDLGENKLILQGVFPDSTISYTFINEEL